MIITDEHTNFMFWKASDEWTPNSEVRKLKESQGKTNKMSRSQHTFLTYVQGTPFSLIDGFTNTRNGKLKVDEKILNKRHKLDKLYNKYGYFKVAHLQYEGNCPNCRGYWYSWLEARKSKHLVEKSNQRTILRCEVVLDIDEPSIPESLVVLDEIREKLEENRIKHTSYSTGSKGYHVHIIDPDLLKYNYHERKAIRKAILKKYGVDEQKASDKVMIAMPEAPHWKSGKPKAEVTA